MQRTVHGLTILLLAVSALLYSGNRPEEPPPQKPGEIIDRVVCRNDPGQTYAVYLPSSYQPDEDWPLLVAFEPAARARLPLERFERAAERFGYIVVCSHNIKNGPTEPVVTAMRALWQDCLSRFSIDQGRIYATGFSGGARVASFFNRVIENPVRGIIACGAGLASGMDVRQLQCSLYYAAVGTADFNYMEMKRLDKNLDDTSVRHHLHIFEGPHRWPDPNICLRALAWMEMHSMRRGFRPADTAMIDRLYSEQVGAVREQQRIGPVPFAVDGYRMIIHTYDAWKDTGDLQDELESLEKAKKYRRFLKNESAREQEEQRIVERFIGIFAFIERKNPARSDLATIVTGLGIKDLVAQAGKDKNIFQRDLAFRLLHILNLKAESYMDKYADLGDQKRCLIFSEVYSASGELLPWHSYMLYRVARLYAAFGELDQAIGKLEEASSRGFAMNEVLKSDLETIWSQVRDRKQFKRIVAEIAANREKRGKDVEN